MSTPSWINTLSNASIAADMAAADVNGTVTYAGLDKLLTDLDAQLTSSKSTLTASELSDLKTIVSNLNNGMSTSSYLTSIMTSFVDGSAANATWTGGGATATALGNLAVGSSATQVSELIGKWFAGTDTPSSAVSMDGQKFSISYSTNSNPLFGASGPSMNDINQGYLGDCFFESSIAEVAKQNSGDISSMFTSNGNGTYGVRFYVNGVAQYVTVDSALADGGQIFNSGSDNWASLAEKAYTQFQATAPTTGNGGANFGNSYSSIGNGGSPEYALETVTGASRITDFYANGSSWYSVVYNSSLAGVSSSAGNSTASVLSTLASDLAKGDDVVLSSWTNAYDSSGKQTLVASHAMSVYGYDSSTGELEVRNPWGTESGQYWDTTFEVSLSTLLSDGDTITADNIGTGGNTTPTPPTVTAQTGNQTWKQGQAVSFQLAANTFTDPQGQTLTYTATQANGSALPSWLTFNAATRTFSGTPPNGAETLSLKVTATDTSGLSVSETFNASVVTGPVVTAQTANQTWKQGQAVNFQLAANTFTDAAGQTLTYRATQANGSALPSWLSFNATSGTFTGTPPSGAGTLAVTVTATDTNGFSTSETFNATLVGAPNVTAQTAAQTWKQGQAVSFQLAANTFTDPQGQTLTYTATQANGSALPSWLTFNAATKTFSGTPPSGAGTLSLKVTATDTSGLATSETFNATLVGAPNVTAQTAAQTWKQGQAVSFQLAANTFTDPQGQTLTYSATQANGSALPSWLTFNAATKTFSGTPPSGAGTLSLKVTATDTSGLATSETFNATLVGAPTVSAQTAAQTWKQGQAVSFQLAANTFTDPQGQTLTYSATQANGSALPSWLAFNASTRTFSGTPPSNASALSLKVTATDSSGLSSSETFAAAIDAPPSVTAQTANVNWNSGQSFNVKLASNTFTDPQGLALTETATQSNGSALPSWMSFNAATQSFSGTAPSSAGSFTFKVTGTDSAGLSASETFNVTVAALSHAISGVSSSPVTGTLPTVPVTSVVPSVATPAH